MLKVQKEVGRVRFAKCLLDVDVQLLVTAEVVLGLYSSRIGV